VKKIAIQGLAVLSSLCLAAIAEQCFERLWVVTMPSGNREIYHGSVSIISSILLFGAVAVVIYKVTIRAFKRIAPR